MPLFSGARVRWGIAAKIMLVAGLLGCAAVAIGWLGIDAMRTYSEQVARINNASARAVVAERVNGLVTAVVMESRGVYMARDRDEVERFGAPLEKGLAALSAEIATWSALMPGARVAEIAPLTARLQEFIRYRTELVRIGRTEGGPASRVFGDNDANRTNRQALNREVAAVAAANAAEVGALAASLEAYRADALRWLLALTIGGVGALLAISAWVVVAGVTRPLRRILAVIPRLAEADAALEIPERRRTDEIGTIARALDAFKDSKLEADRLRAAQASEKARAEAERRAMMHALAERFQASVGAIAQSITAQATELQATAEAMTESSQRTAERSTSVAAASEQTTANVQTVATATEQLSTSVGEIGDRIGDASRMIEDAVDRAERSNREIEALNAAAEKIDEVVTLIHQIAGQTNLLALNATIEAARAGEAGKGFAVVASEVKQLATQTARATEDISGHVKAIQSSTRTSASSIRDVAATIRKVDETSTAIAGAVAQQSAATQEIVRNVHQAAAGTEHVTTTIADVSATAQQAGSAAEQVLMAVAELNRSGASLIRQLDTFLDDVRAA